MFDKYHISSRLILEEAIGRGIEAVPIDGSKLAKLSLGSHVEYLFAQFSSKTTSVANRICKNKALSKIFIERAGIKVAEGSLFGEKQLADAIDYCNKQLLWPVVLKPKSEEKGKGVFVGIENPEKLASIWGKIEFDSEEIIIEKYFEGTEYRVLATNEHFLAATKRIPANILGDGVNTIRKLIDVKNSEEKRREDNTGPWYKILIDSNLENTLLEQNLNLDSVLKADQRVYLKKNSNLSTGGDSYDVTDSVHGSIKQIAVQAVRAIPGLPYAGVDIICKDVASEQHDGSYIVVEINSSPGISMHHYPYSGKPRNVAKDIVDVIFPETKTN
jgi:cyanophycin synthetase